MPIAQSVVCPFTFSASVPSSRTADGLALRQTPSSSRIRIPSKAFSKRAWNSISLDCSAPLALLNCSRARNRKRACKRAIEPNAKMETIKRGPPSSTRLNPIDTAAKTRATQPATMEPVLHPEPREGSKRVGRRSWMLDRIILRLKIVVQARDNRWSQRLPLIHFALSATSWDTLISRTQVVRAGVIYFKEVKPTISSVNPRLHMGETCPSRARIEIRTSVHNRSCEPKRTLIRSRFRGLRWSEPDFIGLAVGCDELD